MSDRSKPHPWAAALGRKGGKAKGKPKGFAAISPERLKEIIESREAKRKARAELAKNNKDEQEGEQ